MKIEGCNVLITGGAGFIGSHIVDMFINNNAQGVKVLDNLISGNKAYIKDKNIEFIKADILDYKILNDAMKDIDIVSHHAAELEVFTGIQNTIHDLRTNTEGTLNVLNSALENDVELLINASSGAVYGQAQYLPEGEDHPLNPHWPYGVSKLAAEKYCRQYYLLYGLPTVSFRYAIVYGPREWYGRVLTLFIKRLLEGKAPIIFGDGKQKRDYVYIDDVVKANQIAIEKIETAKGLAFNVGGNRSYRVKDVAEILIELLNSEIKPIYDDPKPGESSKYQPNRKRLPGELKDFELDNTLINKELNFSPETNFEEGAKKEIDWVRENIGFWEKRPRV